VNENSQICRFFAKNLQMNKKLQMHKILAIAKIICKSAKNYEDIHVGIVLPSKNLQMHKILENRQISSYLTKYNPLNLCIIALSTAADTSNHW
jgi:hypothetical protein